MINKIIDERFHFQSVFDTATGFYIRSGIIDTTGHDTGVDPFMASYPQLIDIGIMGHCEHGRAGYCLEAGIECYQRGSEIQKPNMKLEDFLENISRVFG